MRKRQYRTTMREHLEHLWRYAKVYWSQPMRWLRLSLLVLVGAAYAQLDIMIRNEEAEGNRARVVYKNYQKMMKTVPKAQQNALEKYCEKYDVPIHLVLHLVQVESEWNPTCVGPINSNGSRDFGLGQINSDNIASFSKQYYSGKEPFDVFNPIHNLEVTVRYLRDLYITHSSWSDAVCAYNAGSYSVFSGRIPKSTQLYVKSILGNRDSLL